MKEIWKECPLNYSIKISNKGNIEGAVPYIGKRGYQVVVVRNTFFQNKKYVHLLVSELFGTKVKKCLDLTHKDGNPNNNSIDNLIPFDRMGKINFLYSQWTKKDKEISITKVVRKLYKTRKFYQSDLAEFFKISQSQVHRILFGRNH